MNIIKIGGAVLKSQRGFEAMLNILNEHTQRPLLIVISAFSKATRELEKAAKLAESGAEKDAYKILDTVIEEHIAFATNLLKDPATLESLTMLFESSKQRLYEFAKGLNITGELTARTLDAILSFGEFFALHTVNHYLKEQGFSVYCVDSTSLIVSDDNYGNARPLIKETAKQIKDKLIPKIDNNSIVLTQGFVAKNRSGETTTMGIESSNLTAVLYAEILNAKTITFWTDVCGIRTADPKVVKNSLPVSALSYEDAFKAASNGLKLIHPQMLEHISNQKISLVYKSAFEPVADETMIAEQRNISPKTMVIAYEDLLFTEIQFSNGFSKTEADSMINKILLETNDIIMHSVFSESIRIIFKKSGRIEKMLKRKFNHDFAQPCTVITILHAENFRYKFVNNIILDKFIDSIINFDCNPETIRLIVKPEISSEILVALHEFTFGN